MFSTETTIDLTGFTAYCHINDDGEHTTSCIENLSCLRYKMAPLVPLASSGPWAKQVTPRREPVSAPELSPLSSEWQARTLAHPRLLARAPGLPIPGREPEKPASPVPEFPRPSTDWATWSQAPQSSPWQYPQTSEWQARTFADPRVLASGFPLPIKEKPASPAPTTRPPPGLNVQFNMAELVQPKPVHPCGNPQAKSTMADFLARYSPNELVPSWVEVRSQVLHPGSDYNPWA
ncbi:hypothetical protein QBC37DRAFT_374821 [Rhypophila decipiens]|uniref:Uncharacterized protein n=1 Tax=Rhypophila decipiens TaxID=261697 RepID=A0AAN6Y4Q9_9PEZI|nr:hypothetical protein QBC37DRAFT_374821 [Rhypophila decipiens]